MVQENDLAGGVWIGKLQWAGFPDDLQPFDLF
jgi:hypothetical protein